jgi:hypothetical protein
VGDETPLVCRLDALTAAERRRYAELTGELAASVRRVEELPRGWAFRFSDDPWLPAHLVEWMSLERRCCPFLEFELTFGEGRDPAMLRLTGEGDVKAFLAHEIGAFFRREPAPRPPRPRERPAG